MVIDKNNYNNNSHNNNNSYCKVGSLFLTKRNLPEWVTRI